MLGWSRATLASRTGLDEWTSRDPGFPGAAGVAPARRDASRCPAHCASPSARSPCRPQRVAACRSSAASRTTTPVLLATNEELMREVPSSPRPRCPHRAVPHQHVPAPGCRHRRPVGLTAGGPPTPGWSSRSTTQPASFSRAELDQPVAVPFEGRSRPPDRHGRRRGRPGGLGGAPAAGRLPGRSASGQPAQGDGERLERRALPRQARSTATSGRLVDDLAVARPGARRPCAELRQPHRSEVGRTALEAVRRPPSSWAAPATRCSRIVASVARALGPNRSMNRSSIVGSPGSRSSSSSSARVQHRGVGQAASLWLSAASASASCRTPRQGSTGRGSRAAASRRPAW